MRNPGESTVAARLCSACGMCCNGVMFYSMRLQPSDQARSLTALGLKLKRKNKEWHFLQPCPAHQDSHCTIYAQRPERCRVFACRQLQAVENGKTSEEAAMKKVRDAQDAVARVRELLHQAGDTRETKALATRYETLVTPPLDPAPEAEANRKKLTEAMNELEDMLARDFRVEAARKLEGCGLSHPLP